MLAVEKALTYMSEDPRADRKIGLGAVIGLAPILNLAAIGYQVEVARCVMRGEPQPLAEWDDLKRLWKQGAKLGLALYLYSLPLVLFVLGGMLAIFAGSVLTAQPHTAQTSQFLTAPLAAMTVMVSALIGLAVLYSFGLGLLRPAILAEYARRGSVQACFDIGALWRFIRPSPRDYLLVWLTEAVMGAIISLPLIFVVMIISFIPFVGPLLASLLTGTVGFYFYLVSSHLVGQLLRARMPATA